MIDDLQACILIKSAAGKGKLLQPLLNVARMALGGGAAAYANNEYLSSVNPDVTDRGRLGSNVWSGVLGAALASKGGAKSYARAFKNSPGLASTATAGMIAARYGLIMPAGDKGPVPMIGLGGYVDAGKSKLPQAVKYIHEHPDALAETLAKPTENVAAYAGRKGYEQVSERVLDNDKLKDGLSKQIKEDFLPGVYRSLITSLGAIPSKTPTLAELGTAASPHVIGGGGGVLLGSAAASTLGNYLFADNDKDDYETRRRQDTRRGWLKFLGANAGGLAGLLAVNRYAPTLGASISEMWKSQTPETVKPASYGQEKVGASPKITGALTSLLKNLGVGAGVTAAQYGAGMTDRDNNQSLLPLFLGNSLFLGGKIRKGVSGRGGQRTGRPVADAAARPNPYMFPAAAAWAAGGPRASTASTALFDGTQMLSGDTKRIFPLPSVLQDAVMRGTIKRDDGHPSTDFQVDTGDLGASAGRGLRRGVQEGDATRREAAIKLKNPDISDADLRIALGPTKDLQDIAMDSGTEFAGDVATKAGVPTTKDLKTLAQPMVMTAIAQGLSAGGGGVLGMAGGGAIADAVLRFGRRKGWWSKNDHRDKFLTDATSLVGAGAGALGGLSLANKYAPGVVDWYKGTSKVPVAAGTT